MSLNPKLLGSRTPPGLLATLGRVNPEAKPMSCGRVRNLPHALRVSIIDDPHGPAEPTPSRRLRQSTNQSRPGKGHTTTQPTATSHNKHKVTLVGGLGFAPRCPLAGRQVYSLLASTSRPPPHRPSPTNPRYRCPTSVYVVIRRLPNTTAPGLDLRIKRRRRITTKKPMPATITALSQQPHHSIYPTPWFVAWKKRAPAPIQKPKQRAHKLL